MLTAKIIVDEKPQKDSHHVSGDKVLEVHSTPWLHWYRSKHEEYFA